LHFKRTRVIDVVTATPTSKEKYKMTTLIPEENGTPTATATIKGKPMMKALVASRRANVAPAKAKSGRKPKLANKAHKGRTKLRIAKPKVVRDGSKTANVLELLKRPGGATSQELTKATAWLPHSVRGFLSGTVRKKMGLTVISTKGQDGERTYSVQA
jgi:hypothetical protein